MTPDAPGLPEPRRTVAVAAVLAAMSLVVLDAGAVNVALPSIGRDLGAAPADALLVVTAYQATLLMALLPLGAVGERYGHRRVFAAGVGVFAGASALCAFAPSLAWLAAARGLQGLGGAAVMALGVALLRQIVTRSQLGAAIGWNALTVALSSAMAPSLGALVLHHGDWRWLFGATLPVAAFALAAARALPRGERFARPLDVASMVLNAAAFGLFAASVEALADSLMVALCGLAGAAAIVVALVRRESRKAAPLIPIDLLRRPTFRAALAASVCCFTAQSAGILSLTFHLQSGVGLPPLLAGLYLTPWPLAVAAASVVAGRAAERLPAAWLCAVGGACLAAGLALTAFWAPAAGDAPWIVACTALCGVGFGLFQTPNNRSIFLAAPDDRGGAAGGAQATARLLGQAAGGLLVALLFGLVPVETGARAGLAIAAAAALAAALVSVLRARLEVDTVPPTPSVRNVTPANAEG